MLDFSKLCLYSVDIMTSFLYYFDSIIVRLYSCNKKKIVAWSSYLHFPKIKSSKYQNLTNWKNLFIVQPYLVEVAVRLSYIYPFLCKLRISDPADPTLDVEELAHVPCPAEGNGNIRATRERNAKYCISKLGRKVNPPVGQHGVFVFRPEFPLLQPFHYSVKDIWKRIRSVHRLLEPKTPRGAVWLQLLDV